jgi:hypothetical protein
MMNRFIDGLIAYSTISLLSSMASASPSPANGRRTCSQLYVAVPTAQVPEAVMYGELCRPTNTSWPNKVQLLVHGTGHNRYCGTSRSAMGVFARATRPGRGLGDLQHRQGRHGKIDDSQRIRTGLSVAVTVETLHIVAQHLRNGTLCSGGECVRARIREGGLRRPLAVDGDRLATRSGLPATFDAFVLLEAGARDDAGLPRAGLQLYVPTTNERSSSRSTSIRTTERRSPGLADRSSSILTTPIPACFVLDEILRTSLPGP